jgi:hypothetical protein
VSNRGCIACAGIICKRYIAKNPERREAIQASWRARNADHVANYAKATKQDKYAKAAAQRRANPEFYREQARIYREANKELCNERSRRSVARKPEYYRKKGLQWHADNPGKSNAGVQARRAAKASRTPSWSDDSAIRAVYELAQEAGLTVDHIVPLRGRLVSGLHVENNLQLLTLAENVRKGNKFRPEEFHMGPGPHPSVADRIRSAAADVKVYIG